MKAGQGQVVLLSGEAGIGKSRLVQMLKEHVANEPQALANASVRYYQNTALYPLIDLLATMTLQLQAEERPDEKLGKLEQTLSPVSTALGEIRTTVCAFAVIARPENRYPLTQFRPHSGKQKTLETLVAMLHEHRRTAPVLFILEDLHWADPTTLELLNLLLDQDPTDPL